MRARKYRTSTAPWFEPEELRSARPGTCKYLLAPHGDWVLRFLKTTQDREFWCGDMFVIGFVEMIDELSEDHGIAIIHVLLGHDHDKATFDFATWLRDEGDKRGFVVRTFINDDKSSEGMAAEL
jgi:hypothetical protein